MIKIRPNIEEKIDCPICQKSLLMQKILWQGIHICAETHCSNCEKDFISDLSVGHSVHASFHVAKDSYELYGERAIEWLGVPLQKSLHKPSSKPVQLTIKKRGPYWVMLLSLTALIIYMAIHY